MIGKFLGALISVSIPFTLAALMNLLMVSSASGVHLNIEAWGRLGIIFFIALLYTCFFLALGLLVSARVQRSAVSLVILLLIWVTFVVFMPGPLASIASEFSSSMSADEKWTRYSQKQEEILDKYNYVAWSDEVDRKTLMAKRAFFTEKAEMIERLNQEYLTSQNGTGSTYAVYPLASHPLHSLQQSPLNPLPERALRGILQFVGNVERYARQYREFVVDH